MMIEPKASLAVLATTVSLIAKDISGKALSDAEAETRVRNAVKLATALHAIFPALDGPAPGQSTPDTSH